MEADSFMLVFESDWSLTGVPLGVKIIIYSAATQRSRSTLHRSATTNSWTKADWWTPGHQLWEIKTWIFLSLLSTLHATTQHSKQILKYLIHQPDQPLSGLVSDDGWAVFIFICVLCWSEASQCNVYPR